jgi:hypothetical protein
MSSSDQAPEMLFLTDFLNEDHETARLLLNSLILTRIEDRLVDRLVADGHCPIVESPVNLVTPDTPGDKLSPQKRIIIKPKKKTKVDIHPKTNDAISEGLFSALLGYAARRLASNIERNTGLSQGTFSAIARAAKTGKRKKKVVKLAKAKTPSPTTAPNHQQDQGLTPAPFRYDQFGRKRPATR